MADRLNLEHDFSDLDEGHTVRTHTLYRKVDRILSRLPAGRVLEVGCNNGMLLQHLAARGWDVTGTDLHDRPEPYIIEHDASEPFPFESEFDVVVATEVIEHIVDTEAFLAHCAAVLKPGGRLILTTPNLLFGVNRVLMLIGRKPAFAYADYHVRMFVWSDLSAKVERHFKIDRVQGSHVLIGLRRYPTVGRIAAWLGDRAPRLAAHFIVSATVAPTDPDTPSP